MKAIKLHWLVISLNVYLTSDQIPYNIICIGTYIIENYGRLLEHIVLFGDLKCTHYNFVYF